MVRSWTGFVWADARRLMIGGDFAPSPRAAPSAS
jgi:hypothetical protein